jgi:hypothetical protein
MRETGGLCKAIITIPLKTKGKVYLDAFASISSTPTILFETATERYHRPNRNLWAEIEYLLKLRIDTMYWTIPDRDELRTQLEQAEYDPQIFKKSNSSRTRRTPKTTNRNCRYHH